MKTALVVGMAAGATVGFIIGAKFESQVLRDLGLLQVVYRYGIDGPFLRVGGLFAGLGGLLGAGMVHILRATRAR